LLSIIICYNILHHLNVSHVDSWILMLIACILSLNIFGLYVWDLSIFIFWKPHLLYLLLESFIIKFLSFDGHHQFLFLSKSFLVLESWKCFNCLSSRAYASKLDDWSLFCSNVQTPWSLCKFPKISNSSQSILCFHYLKMRLVHLFHQNIVLLFFLMRDYQWQCLIKLVRTYLHKMLRIKGNYTTGQRSFRMFGHFACHGLNPCSMRRV
jgi:hypothetical protein